LRFALYLALHHDCSDCFRLERIAGWGLHPLESAALSRQEAPFATSNISMCYVTTSRLMCRKVSKAHLDPKATFTNSPAREVILHGKDEFAFAADAVSSA
jgi:hypothetical protein